MGIFHSRHLASLPAQSLRLSPQSQEVGRRSFSSEHAGAVGSVSLQFRPEVRQTGQEALQRIGLRGQGIRVATNRAEGVQFVVEVGKSGEDIAYVRLDLADTLKSGLQ